MEEWVLKSEPKFRYMLLDRMRQDCRYYFGNDNCNPENLCQGDEKAQIEAMKVLWNSFPEEDRPEWLTWEDILEFERKMIGGDDL